MPARFVAGALASNPPSYVPSNLSQASKLEQNETSDGTNASSNRETLGKEDRLHLFLP